MQPVTQAAPQRPQQTSSYVKSDATAQQQAVLRGSSAAQSNEQVMQSTSGDQGDSASTPHLRATADYAKSAPMQAQVEALQGTNHNTSAAAAGQPGDSRSPPKGTETPEAQAASPDAAHTAAAHDVYVVPEKLQQPLCGASRPHFFRGVATVVTKLFNIVEPDIAVFGRKDFQQLVVIRALVRDLDFGIQVTGGPIAREFDGLASSSRNARLTEQARAAAPVIHRALQRGREMWQVQLQSQQPADCGTHAAGAGAARASVPGQPPGAAAQDAGEAENDAAPRGNTGVFDIKMAVAGDIVHGGCARLDYVEIVHAEDLTPLQAVGQGPAVLAVAAFFEGRGGQDVRLIDNIDLSDGGS